MNQFALSDKQKKWAYDKWCDGYTVQQIADALYVCTRTVERALKDLPRVRPALVYPYWSEEASV